MRKGKKDFYGNLEISKVTDNRVFLKIVKPKISDKVKISSKITLVEDDKILSQDAEIAKTFINEYFIAKYPNFKYAKRVLLKKILFQE